MKIIYLSDTSGGNAGDHGYSPDITDSAPAEPFSGNADGEE